MRGLLATKIMYRDLASGAVRHRTSELAVRQWISRTNKLRRWYVDELRAVVNDAPLEDRQAVAAGLTAPESYTARRLPPVSGGHTPAVGAGHIARNDATFRDGTKLARNWESDSPPFGLLVHAFVGSACQPLSAKGPQVALSQRIRDPRLPWRGRTASLAGRGWSICSSAP